MPGKYFPDAMAIFCRAGFTVVTQTAHPSVLKYRSLEVLGEFRGLIADVGVSLCLLRVGNYKGCPYPTKPQRTSYENVGRFCKSPRGRFTKSSYKFSSLLVRRKLMGNSLENDWGRGRHKANPTTKIFSLKTSRCVFSIMQGSRGLSLSKPG